GFEPIGAGLFRVNRDSEMEIDEEAEDLVRLFESALKRRRRGTVIRLTLSADMPPDMASFVTEKLHVAQSDVYTISGPIGFADATQMIVDDRPELTFVPYNARFPERIRDFGG
ncbi:MAG: RNA degradosome polyphosphate kinase, partial [Elsteraceae bacterium]